MNTSEGSKQILDAYDTRAEAATAGRRLARHAHAEHVTHHPDGSIDEITVTGG